MTSQKVQMSGSGSAASFDDQRRGRPVTAELDDGRPPALRPATMTDALDVLRYLCGNEKSPPAVDIADIEKNMTNPTSRRKLQKFLIHAQMQNLCSNVGVDLWSIEEPRQCRTLLPSEGCYAALKRNLRLGDDPFVCVKCRRSAGVLRLVDHGVTCDDLLRTLSSTLKQRSGDERQMAVDHLKAWLQLKRNISPPEFIYCRFSTSPFEQK